MVSLPCKSAAAFRFTVDRLAAHNDKLYFWTLTFRQTPETDEVAMQKFTYFMKWLSRTWCNGLLRGVRVCEFHQEHGLHYHLIINKRIPVQVMRRAGARYGFGRMHVSKCDRGVSSYLTKYMTKEYRTMYPSGMRRWGTVGGFKATRVRDVVLESNYSRNKRKIAGKDRVTFLCAVVIGQFTNFFGPVKNWPAWCLSEVERLMKRKVEREEKWEHSYRVKWCAFELEYASRPGVKLPHITTREEYYGSQSPRQWQSVGS